MSAAVRLGLMAVASPLEVGAAQAPVLMQRLQRALEGAGLAGLDLVPAPRPVNDPASAVEVGRAFYDRRVDAVAVVAASWFEDYLVLDLLEECNVPIIAWARPGMETGSLCGMQQLGMLLKQLDQPYLFLFAEVEDAEALAQAWDFCRAVALRRQLRHARIGYLGHRVEGMTETTAHELALKRQLGPRVVGLDTQLFLARAAQVPPETVAGHWQALQALVGQVTAASEAGIEALQVYTALKATLDEAGLAAVAVGCYPHLMGKVCLAASLLGEEGLPVACEGDVNGAVAMLMLTRLSGKPVHNTDLLDPIPAHNSIVFSHCGSGGFSLASGPAAITLSPVRLMECGLCCRFTARPGPVTLLNLVPSLSGYRLAALYGEALETEMVFPGNPLEVRFAADYHALLQWIAAEGLGHHWMATYGDLRPSLRHLAALTGCDWLEKA